MKLFYQLSPKQQDFAVEHCADLVANNAVENGLHVEAINENEGLELKERIDALFKELNSRSELQSKEEKLQFLMEDSVFSDTIMDLANEMAHNAFYHDSDELVVFIDVLNQRDELEEDSDQNDDINDVGDLLKTDSKKYLN